MVNFEEFLHFIKNQDYYDNQVFHIEHIPAQEASFSTLQKPLRKRLQRWLDTNNIKLWRHQAEAINKIREGQNTVIVTSTASGKS
ncbi:MAG: DEAD/DEAH box helicase, partial [Promethearchaeota archaeon]